MPSIERKPSPRNALSDARLELLRAPWLCCHDHLLSTLFEPSSVTSRSPFGLGPRPCAPLPAERTSRDLGVVRRLLQPSFDTRAHPSSHRFLAREWELAFPLLAGIDRCRLRWPEPPRYRDEASEPRPPARLLSRGAPRLRREGGHGPERSSEGRPRALDEIAWALLVVAPSTRVTDSVRRWAWIARRVTAPAKAHLGCLPAKGDTVGRTEVLWVATEPVRKQPISRLRAPGSRPFHAASVEELLERAIRLWGPPLGALR